VAAASAGTCSGYGGGGAHTDWNLNAAGVVGATGSTGPTYTFRDALTSDGTNVDFNPNDPNVWFFRDDFSFYQSGCFSGAGLVGLDTPWNGLRLGSDNGTCSAPASVSGHPGILRITTSANTLSDGIYIYKYAVQNFGSGMTGSAWAFRVIFRIVTNTNEIVRMGLADTQQTAPTNFIGLRFDQTTGSADTYWTFETRSANTPTANAGNVNITPTGSNWMDLLVSSSGSGVIVFTLTDVTGATTTTYTNSNSNVPTALLLPYVEIVDVNSAGYKTLDIDLYSLTYRFPAGTR